MGARRARMTGWRGVGQRFREDAGQGDRCAATIGWRFRRRGHRKRLAYSGILKRFCCLMLARLLARSSVTLRADGLRHVATGDLDLAGLHGLRDFADEFNRQQSVLEAGTRHLDVVGKPETPFKARLAMPRWM